MVGCHQSNIGAKMRSNAGFELLLTGLKARTISPC